jgi:4-hydroxy-2-oxoheptanedioate aldolase
MASGTTSGADFRNELRAGRLKLGLFLNSHSPTVAEQLAHREYDWLLVDSQHGPMGYEKLSAMLCGISSGGAKSIVRVGGYGDRPGIQQSLDLGADGVFVPYINIVDEARQAVSCEFFDKGFTFISISNDLHHVLTQAGTYMKRC